MILCILLHNFFQVVYYLVGGKRISYLLKYYCTKYIYLVNQFELKSVGVLIDSVL